MTRPRVLFVCTHNSARSQMAEGLLRTDHGDKYEALSAGTEATRVKPEAVEALGEIGIDISDHRSKTVDELAETADYVVTVCDDAREACPFVPATRARVHRAFRDPSRITSSPQERLQAFRESRDEIRVWLRETFSEVPPRF